jgi:hypothetical protein
MKALHPVLGALLLATLAPALPARAHELDAKRALAIEPSDGQLHLLVRVEVPSGKRATAIWLLADADHDGRLSTAERRRLDLLMAERALAGVTLETVTATGAARLVLPDADVKVRAGDTPRDRIEALLHASVRRPTRVALRVRLDASAAPISVRVLDGDAPLRASRGARAEGSVADVLHGGESITLSP